MELFRRILTLATVLVAIISPAQAIPIARTQPERTPSTEQIDAMQPRKGPGAVASGFQHLYDGTTSEHEQRLIERRPFRCYRDSCDRRPWMMENLKTRTSEDEKRQRAKRGINFHIKEMADSIAWTWRSHASPKGIYSQRPEEGESSWG